MESRRTERQDDELKLLERVRKYQAKFIRLFEDVQGYAAPMQLDRRTVDITVVLQDSADQIRTLHPSRSVDFGFGLVADHALQKKLINRRPTL